MSTLFIIFGFIAIAVLAGALYAIFTFLQVSSQQVKKELSDITNRVNTHLEQTARMSQQTGSGAVKMMSDVYTRLGSLEESTQKIFEIGKDIGELQDVLKAPKARGGFGELLLADLLRQMIPRDHFQLQYAFRNGTRVDATIFVGDHLVPIDAKFPLENFQKLISSEEEERRKAKQLFVRDVKKHVDAIAKRYILPDEGTFDFALMYVPAENVYYEIVSAGQDESGESLSQYALDQHVIPVSPNSFYAYLQVILLGLRGLRVDEAAREIAESLMKLRGDFKRISSDFTTLGTHLNHAQGSHDRVLRGLDKFENKLSLVDQVKAMVGDEKTALEEISN